jgi:hypothetical protein
LAAVGSWEGGEGRNASTFSKVEEGTVKEEHDAAMPSIMKSVPNSPTPISKHHANMDWSDELLGGTGKPFF